MDDSMLQHTDFTNDPLNDFIWLYSRLQCVSMITNTSTLWCNKIWYCFPRTMKIMSSPGPIVAGHRRAQRRSLHAISRTTQRTSCLILEAMTTDLWLDTLELTIFNFPTLHLFALVFFPVLIALVRVLYYHRSVSLRSYCRQLSYVLLPLLRQPFPSSICDSYFQDRGIRRLARPVSLWPKSNLWILPHFCIQKLFHHLMLYG